MNGRGYDYGLGRFLSVDPFIQAPGNSQSINGYSYIMNNPLAGVDPTGYESVNQTEKLQDVPEGTHEITNSDGEVVGTITIAAGLAHVTRYTGAVGRAITGAAAAVMSSNGRDRVQQDATKGQPGQAHVPDSIGSAAPKVSRSAFQAIKNDGDSENEQEKNYNDLIQNNGEFRKQLYKKLKGEAEKLVKDFRTMTRSDIKNVYGEIGSRFVEDEIGTLRKFSDLLDMKGKANTSGEVVEVVLLQYIGKLAKVAWGIISESNEAFERTQFNQQDIEGWVGACNPKSIGSAGHCGFYDPSYIFHDINEFMPRASRNH